MIRRAQNAHTEADRALRDISRAASERERELLAVIAELERQVRNLTRDLSLERTVDRPTLSPEAYRDPRTPPRGGLGFSMSRMGKRGKSGGERATTSSRSGASPKVQGRAQTAS